MSNSSVYKMLQIDDYAFDSIDCFVCAAHDDGRSVEAVKRIVRSGTEVTHAIIIKYDNGSKSDGLDRILGGIGEELFVPSNLNGFITLFRKAIEPYLSKKIVVDISCIRIPDIFSIMKILKLNKYAETLACVYSVPFDYEYFAGDFSYKSSLGDLQNYELTGYSGDYDPSEENSTYVVFMGFEGALSLKILEEAEYKHLTFVNGLPSLYQKYKDISILNNRSSIKGKRYDSILYTPADNPFEVYNFLEHGYADLPAVSISPLATKPVALGVCMFALDHDNVRIVYPISDVYSPHITNEVVKTWVYEISL